MKESMKDMKRQGYTMSVFISQEGLGVIGKEADYHRGISGLSFHFLFQLNCLAQPEE